LLSFLMLLAPVATLAGSVKAAEANAAATEGQRKLTNDQKLDSYLFANAPAPAATPDVKATMTDSFADADADGKAEFGETITYTADIKNNGPVAATGVKFDAALDPNTDIVPGSVKVSPLAFADTYVTAKNVVLNAGAPGLLTNDSGTPAPTVSAIVGCFDVTAPFTNCDTTQAGGKVTVNADGSFDYTPPSGFEGADTFQYTISNGQTPDSTATATINVDAAPTVTSTTPTNSANGVDPSANITVNFSENVNVTANTFKIECPTGSNIPFALTPSAPGGTNAFTLNPTADLPGGTTCTVTVTGTEVTDVDTFDPPDNMAADYVFTFTTDAAPAVTTTSPTNGATGVATDSNVVVNFTENVTVTTSSFKIECPAVGNLQTFAVTGSGTSAITLNPNANLPAGTTCTVTAIALQISDSDAFDPPDHPAADYVFSFTTDAPPSVTSTTPTNGATNGASNANIVVNFSEPVNVTASAFTIKCPAAGAAIPYGLTPAAPGASNTFTLDPTTDLPGGTTCQVTVVATQVTDVDAGDPPDNMVADYVFSFSIDAAPSVTTTVPTNGATQVAQNTNLTINFSENVDLTSNAVTVTCATSGAHTGVISGSLAAYTFNPDTDFTTGELCTATVHKDEVSDQDTNDPPNNMVADYVFTFTIDLAPSVSSTTPINNATGVAANTNVTVVFSEPVNVTTNTFTIECPAGSSANAYGISGNGTATIVLDPTANLPVGAQCTVTVNKDEVSDVDAGDPPDHMAADYVFTFKIPPVANDDTHPQTVIGNVNVNSANIPFSVTANNDVYAAADPVTIDKVQAATTVVTNTITATTAQGGTVVMTVSGADMGKYLYNPPAGYEGGDTFTYQITNGGGSDSATVSLPIAGMVWFINNTAGAGDGRLSSPFNTLAAFQAVNDGTGNHPATGDNIFIYESSTAYIGPVSLLGGQKLFGQDSTSSLAVLTGLTPPSGSAPFPTMFPVDANITKITSAGNAINLNSTEGSNTINGLTVGNTTGIGINGTNFNVLTVGDINIDEPAGTRTGQALGLSGGATTDTVNGTFAVIETTSAVNGVNLTNINGTITVTTGSTATLTGADYQLNGGSASLTYGGTITNTAGRAVDISNKTGGTVDFNGLITDTGGSGISLQSNNATTLTRFDGGLTLSTAANNGIVATSGGVLAITDPDGFNTGVANTITTTTGTPLNVQLTDIHANGLTFKSISANGAANGIVLNTTGTTVGTHGSLVVTGDGNTSVGGNASGGTIQGTTLSAISLTSTLSPSFTNVTIQNGARNGVDGTGVVNFTFKNGTITNVGTGNAGQYEENGFTFSDKVAPFDTSTVSGTVNITSNTITQPRRYGIRINTYSGTISNITVNDNTISGGTTGANIADAIQVLSQGSASTTANITTGTFQNNTISGFRFFDVANNFFIGGIGINVGGGNTGAATSSTIGAVGTPIVINNNHISNVGDNFIKFTFNGRTGLSNVNITNNGTLATPMLNAEGVAMSIYFGGNMTGNALIDNNFMDAHNRAGSSGLAVQSDNGGNVADNTQSFFTITNNRVDHVDGNGIIGIAINNAGDMNIQVKNNSVPTAPTTANRYGIRIAHNSAGPDICADVEGNTVIGSGFASGIGLRKEGTVPGTNAFGIEGMAATATPGVEQFVDGLNTAQPGPPFGDGDGVQLISATSGFTNCNTAPGSMYKPESKLGRDELAQSSQPVQPAQEGVLAAKLMILGSDILTDHLVATMQPAPQAATTQTAATQPAAQQAAQPVAQRVALGGDRITHHNGAAAQPAALKPAASKPAAQKAAEPVALQTNTFEMVKATYKQPATARTQTRRAAADETFTSHASVKPKAQPEAKAQAVAPKSAVTAPKSAATTKALTAAPAAAAAPVVNNLPVTIGTIPSGKTVRVTFQVTVKSAANYTGTLSKVSAQGTVTFDDPNNPPTGTLSVLTDDSDVLPNTGETDPTDTPVDSQPDLVLTKDDGGVTAVPGGTIAYTLTYNNTNGKRAASGVVITETVPANTTFNAGASTAGWNCTPNGNAGSTCTLSIPNLPAGDAGSTATFAVTVDSPVAAGVTLISNTASIADDGSKGADGTPADNSSSDTTPVTAVPNLKIVKTADSPGVKAGQVASYTLAYSNIGNQGATGVVITETVPADSTFNPGASTAGWVCAPNNNAGSTCTLTIGALAGGGSGTATFAVTTSLTPVGTQVDNTASIADDGTNGVDPNTGDNSDTASTQFDDPPTLGNYADTTVFVTQGATVTPSAVPTDDNPGFDLDVTVSAGFTGGATVNDTTGVVTITSAAPAGTYTVTIKNTDNIGQIATKTFQLTVNKSDTTTALASSKNPSFNNQNVTFTATVTSNTAVAGPPTGSVDFFDGATLICDNAPLDGTGKATCSTSTLDIPGSPHSITATYNGDLNFATSTSGILSQVVNPSLHIEVNTLGDESDLAVADEICDVSPAVGEQCTLRAAIETANFVPSDDVISFNASLNNGTISLGSALPDLGDNVNSGNLDITGPGATLLKVQRDSGAAQFRIFTVPSGKTVNISGLTISGGDSALDGGGVSNAGTLNLDDVVVSGNSTDNDGGGVRNNSGGTLTITGSTIGGNTAANLGGGVSNAGTALTIKDSTISDNDAINGGGISNSAGTLTATNSTISGNRARNDGGGLRNAVATATLTNVTVTDNRADSDSSVGGVGGGVGGGIRRISGTVTLRNTIVAENFNDQNPANTPDDISGTVTGSFNLISAGGSGGLVNGVSGNQVGVDPKLRKLEDNGGPTKTHALKPNSPALDAGDNTLATNAGLTDDQRGPGFNRFADSTDADAIATVDTGAYEAQVTVEDISNRGTAEDTTLSAFNFEVAQDVGITGFTVTATSSDTTLVPNANFVLGGAGNTRTLAITPAADKYGTATITVTVSGLVSGVFPTSMSDTFDFTVTPVADTPDVADVATNEDTQSGPIVVTKNPVDGPEVTHFRVSAITGGTLYMPNGTTMLAGDNYVSFTDGALGLRFTPLPNYNGQGHFSVQAATGNIPAALGGGIDTSTITINAVNDQPILGPLNNRFILEDSAGEVITLTGIGAGGNESQTLQVTAVSSNPAIVPNPVINYTSPNSSGTLTYAPVANANGTAVITVTVNDGGGGAETVSRTFSINITPVNDAPSFTKGPDQVVGEDAGPQSVSNWANPISPGAPNESGQVLTFTATNNNNSLFSVQPAISPTGTLTYKPTDNASGTAAVTVVLKDGSGTTNSGQDMSSPPQTFNITVNAVNDAPVNTVPGAQTVVKNGTLTFAQASSKLVKVTDVDAGGAIIKVALTAQKGTVTLPIIAGLTFSMGDGTTDQYMIFTGTISNVNAAMNGMQFKPNANYVGAASLTILSNDLGNTPGPAKTDSDIIAITVTSPPPSSPSTFSLGAPVYSTAEGSLRATVTVTREGDKSAPASVNYKTTDPSAAGVGCGAVTGQASNRCDYATAAGTLRFAAGESSREISIPVVNDAYAEGPESFTVSLSKPTGAKLAGTTSAVVTIADDDANGAAAANPLGSDEFFVRQLYVDVLGREPDEKGLNYWLTTLKKCGGGADCGRAAVASAIFKSDEFKQSGYFAYRLYRAALGRVARFDELTPDAARLASSRDAAELSLNKADLVSDFMAKAEFKDRFGSRTQAADYVDALLLAAGLPNHSQRGAWVAGLSGGSLTRGDVLWQLADSEEVSAKFIGEAEVVLQYHAFLKREADAGVGSGLEPLGQKLDLLKLVGGFLDSAEYRQRFGQ
jgi:methionine-rich copper-binding protein CopC